MDDPLVDVVITLKLPANRIRKARGLLTRKSYRCMAEIISITATTSTGESIPPPIRKSPANNSERDAEIVAAYAQNPQLNASRLAEHYGLSRERVCQILRRTNELGKKHVRHRIAADVLKEESAIIVAKAKADLEEKLLKGVELVRGGKSVRQATIALGVTAHSQFAYALSAKCKALSVLLRHGPHQDYSARKAKVDALHAQGMGPTQIVRVLRGADDPTIHLNWVSNYLKKKEQQQPQTLLPEQGKNQ